MQNLIRKLAILAVIPLAAACAATQDDSAGVDWSKSTTYNVKTANGDRVFMRVLGNEEDGFDYHARIRQTTRADTDVLDRQRVLNSASRTIVARLCPKGANEVRPQFASDNYEQFGRFVCSAK